ncbi:monomeric isocitrate dehydrogenase [Candidatus Scalindua japonica]|uniref:Isocitrate dehydrogenase [NADP] n=1 Tax=Candidatus Scalindua japonica TaxID=1284222 RepID=A0A286TWC5_9BACT|nr:NADP-dependent isocitrate dehydrogenase [Candidatus Scalindua japonica]GAX60190.1 monomeric isocitrate dehydrogenase [Candidatus Scalindua japonica]
MSEQEQPDIIYTITDEAPALATSSFLPIVKYFLTAAGVTVSTRDISLAGRIIAKFPDSLTPEQKQPDALFELGELVKRPTANIIKLPNISASIPQLKAAISELQEKGYDIPDYPEAPSNEAQRDIQARYKKILGSAVNPVLRDGNSDRRPPAAVKEFARKHPHKMGEWRSDSKTHVTHMDDGDFFSNERSVTISGLSVGNARIEFFSEDNQLTVLKDSITLQEGEIVDATFMSRKDLRKFLAEQIEDAKEKGVLFSLHLKATMMKVSDPIIFGQAVEVFFADVFDKHMAVFEELGVNPNNGLGDVYARIQNLPEAQREEIEDDIQACIDTQADLYMVNSDKGITNLHVPSNVIIDASMPPIIRDGGKAWGPDGKAHDVKAVIPDSSYAVIYDETIKFCKENGAFDPETMGSVANVGLMAGKAEEYGSHDQTFKVSADGVIRVADAEGVTLHEHSIEKGDVWRMCRVKDEPVRNWVELGVKRVRITGSPAVFWLDKERAHDAQLIDKVNHFLDNLDPNGDLDIKIMSPVDAIRYTLQRVKDGRDTISVTGNVLRDYLTDLFPILELNTSAKMLSIVGLLNGGGLFETGAGGSAPKHVQQFLEEGHLRWDSVGEFAAIAASLQHLSAARKNVKAGIVAKALDQATARLLINNQSPSNKVGELDNRGSQFYLTLYWAQALAEQEEDPELQEYFCPLAKALASGEEQIIRELNDMQGKKVDLGGYYHPDPEKVARATRPSATLNAAFK